MWQARSVQSGWGKSIFGEAGAVLCGNLGLGSSSSGKAGSAWLVRFVVAW